MKTKITQLTMLIIALVFFNANLNAQSGDFEFLFDTDGDTEGFQVWGDGSITGVAGGVLTYQVSGTGNNGIELPSGHGLSIFANKDTHPIMAMQLSAAPTRLDGFVTYGWWQEALTERNNVADAEFNSLNVYYWDFRSEWDSDSDLFPAGNDPITRMIFRISDDSDGAFDISWIKTFADREALAAYVGITLSVDDVNKSQAKIISGDKKIQIVNSELNSKIQVFDLLGKNIYDSVITSSKLTVNVNTTGLYIVKITNEKGLVLTKKAMVY